MQRIGLFGGSFNPIHFGHLIPAQSAAEQLGLEKLIFVLSANPPHKQADTGRPGASSNLAASDDRFEMVRRAIQGHPLFDVSDVETRRNGPSYTIDTVVHFREQFGLDVLLHWLIGADSLGEIATWRRAGELIDACQVVTLLRPGWPIEAALARLRGRLDDDRIARLADGVIQSPQVDISATQIRRRIAEGKSIRYLLPGVVARHIQDHQLYRHT